MPIKSQHRFWQRSKYNSRSCQCNNGHYHHSRLEAGYCNMLHVLLKAGELKDIKTQKRFDFDINGEHICSYYADFYVTDIDGTESVHEVKGCVTDVYMIKKKLFHALYPSIPFHEIH